MKSIPTLLFLVLAACGDDGAQLPDADTTLPDAMPREVITQLTPLQPGMLAEGVMTAQMGDKARIVLSAPSATLSWNIHGHAGGSTQVVYEEFDKMTAEYVFTAPGTARWWLLLRNDGNVAMEVEVRVELHDTITWEWE